MFSSTPLGAKHQKASVLYNYPDHTPASGFSLSASVPQAGVGCIETGAARVIRAACLCSAVMSLRLCSGVMSFLHNEGPQGAAGEGGWLTTGVIQQECEAAREELHAHVKTHWTKRAHTRACMHTQLVFIRNKLVMHGCIWRCEHTGRTHIHTCTYKLIKGIVMQDPQSLLEPHQC